MLTPTWIVEDYDGRPRVRVTSTGVFRQITREQETEAFKLFHALKSVRNDGNWRVAWTYPGDLVTANGLVLTNHLSVIECQWTDLDGDVSFVVEIDEPFNRFVRTPVTVWVSQCEQAYQEAVGWKQDVDIRPEQTFKRRLGQSSVDPTSAPVI